MSHTFTTYYEDIAFEIEFDYFPASKGSWEGGVQIEPDEPESWEICTIKIFNDSDKNAKAVDVSDCFNKAMNDWFEEQVNDHILDNDEY